MLFSVVVRFETPDKWLVLRTPSRIVTPINYFQIQDILFFSITNSVFLTENITGKK